MVKDKDVLAPYACTETRGRRHEQSPRSAMIIRGCFQKDRDRIIHSTAFRRMANKTQVILADQGRMYRTRLCHSLEVFQIGQTIARHLCFNEDLTEALCLAHDLGHSPFGHSGEKVLQKALENHGGFDHNGQTLRILTLLEKKYADFDGLNLTWETLEGLAKHNGPVKGGHLPFALREVNSQWDLELSSYASGEAQIAAVSDDIAYVSHDLDDALSIGLIVPQDLEEFPVIGDILRSLYETTPSLRKEISLVPRLLSSRIIAALVEDVVAHTQKNIKKELKNLRHVQDIRNLSYALIDFSPEMFQKIKQLKEDFLKPKIYYHDAVMLPMASGARKLEALVAAYRQNSLLLPKKWRWNETDTESQRARTVCDYVAGMTDQFALEKYEQI